MIWILLAVVTLILIVVISFWKTSHQNKNQHNNRNDEFPLPNAVRGVMIGLTAIFACFGMFNHVFFYAEPGYVYHVRTILGDERVVNDTGYSMHLFGRINAWKKAMTVQADQGALSEVNSETESSHASASLPPLNIMFLDQVDADAMATVRYRLPTDTDTFLRMAHEYRTPENLLRVALIPAFQETLQATASLMSAEDYYSGGRTEFINEFENQMQKGVYIVKREEVFSEPLRKQTSEADASNPQNQSEFGSQTKTIFVVNKQYGDDGQPMRKEQKFTLYGIAVHEARITDMRPNDKFVQRMQLKQKASADRAIAREQRIQEEEQRLLAVAKGDREVAQRQAAMKVEQIEITTKAETAKKQTLIEADKLKEQAEIQRQTSEVLLEKAKIDAEAVRVAADAEAYRKREILTADNALAQKLDAEIQIQQYWAEAYAKRKVPQYVLGAGGANGSPVGGDSEVKAFMQLMTVDAAKRLSYSRELDADKSK